VKKQLALGKTRGTEAVAERLKFMNSTKRHAVLACLGNRAKYRNILNNRKVALLIETRSNTDASYMKS
jgi:hypothetical protein